jgi:hypothetical protein
MVRNENMSLTVKQLRAGQTITLVSKGIRHSFGNTYTDETQIGNTSFLEITRIGREYIYGKYIYYEDGKKQLSTWEDKINPAEYLILDGIRTDIQEQFNNYRLKLQEYENKRKEARYKFEREAYDLTRRKMETWDKENPRPTPIDLNQLTTKTFEEYIKARPLSLNYGDVEHG